MGYGDFQHNPDLHGRSEKWTVGALPQVSLLTRLQALIFATRLDREIESGVTPPVGSPLALHVARLTSTRERESVARAFRHMLGERHASCAVAARTLVRVSEVDACRDLIDDITLLLHSPRPVRAVGMARLRILLSDGTGPLYRRSSRDFSLELRGAYAALWPRSGDQHCGPGYSAVG